MRGSACYDVAACVVFRGREGVVLFFSFFQFFEKREEEAPRHDAAFVCRLIAGRLLSFYTQASDWSTPTGVCQIWSFGAPAKDNYVVVFTLVIKPQLVDFEREGRRDAAQLSVHWTGPAVTWITVTRKIVTRSVVKRIAVTRITFPRISFTSRYVNGRYADNRYANSRYVFWSPNEKRRWWWWVSFFLCPKEQKRARHVRRVFCFIVYRTIMVVV